jgi:CubicO group peptidase (beta-lactamase class C family)
MLLSAILQQATGQPLLDFAREALFEPLGITDVDWFSLTDSGETAAFAGLRLRPRDMARVGQLVLDGGVWNGQRVVSQAWVAEAPRRTRTVARRSASATTCATATSGG